MRNVTGSSNVATNELIGEDSSSGEPKTQGGKGDMDSDKARPKKRGRRSLAELRAARGPKAPKLALDKEKAAANSLGSRVRLARKRLGLSQQELADPEYVASYISAIERDKIHPSLKALQLIATRLGEPVEYFLYGGYGSGALVEVEVNNTSASSDTNLSSALRDKLLEAQLLIERAGQVVDYIEQDDLVNAERLLNEIPRHQLTEYDRAQLQKLWGYLYLKRRQFDAARTELEEASTLAVKTGQVALLVEIKNLMGNFYYLRRQVDQALLFHREAWETIYSNEELFEPDIKLRVLTNLANDYLVLGRQEESVNTFRDALRLEEEMARPRQRAKIYWGMAGVYRERGDLLRARNYALMSLTLFRELNQRREILRLSADIGDLLANMGRETEAEKVLTTAVMVGQDDSSLTGTDLALTYTSLAWLRIRQGRIDEARELSHKAIDEAREASDKVAEGKALKLAAEVETKTENREAAQQYYEQAIATLEQVKMPYLLGDVYKAYGEALERWGNFADAVIYLKKAYESKR